MAAAGASAPPAAVVEGGERFRERERERGRAAPRADLVEEQVVNITSWRALVACGGANVFEIIVLFCFFSALGRQRFVCNTACVDPRQSW